MLYRGSIGSSGVFDRINGIDPVFISHIKDLLQKPIVLTDEERSLCREGVGYPEEEASVEAIENRIWGRREGMDPVTIMGRAWANNSKSNYVLYPYGTSTGDCPSRFLGICIGETRLEDVMKAAMDFSAIVANKYRWKDSDRKTVVIITDKWNQKRFNSAYEEQMLAHAVNDGIWYLFLFVNQFDIEQIPFLPNDRSSICRVTWNNFPKKVRKKYARRVLEYSTVVFKSTDYYTGQTGEYVIKKLTDWQATDGSGEGKIDRSKIGQFINVCYDWVDNHFRDDSPGSEDFERFDNGLVIFGKNIYLDRDQSGSILKKMKKLLG